jgi:hypothetical protein
MPAHVDLFEAILSYTPECGYVPTSSDRFEWFLPSVTEGIYASAKTLSLTQQINGTLEWGNIVHLFNHTITTDPVTTYQPNDDWGPSSEPFELLWEKIGCTRVQMFSMNAQLKPLEPQTNLTMVPLTQPNPVRYLLLL